MGDLYQRGLITTIHRLKRRNTDEMEKDLVRDSRVNPPALVLPALFSDLEQDAAMRILDTLKDVPYLKQIVITLGRTGPEEFKEARRIVSILPQKTSLIWNDGPNMQRLYDLLGESGLPVLQDRKGRAA